MDHQTFNSIGILTTAFVAVVALIRPELVTLLKFAFGKARIYPRERVQIGFTNYGPMISILGSLRSSFGTQIVHEMNVTLRRLPDGESHSFTWAFFRSQRIALVQGVHQEAGEAVVANAFSISDIRTKKFDITFLDTTTKRNFESRSLELRETWLRDRIANTEVYNHLCSNQPYEAVSQFQRQHHDLVEACRQEIERNFYWEAGEYEITLNVSTESPTRTNNFRFRFSIDAQEEAQLRGNAMFMIFELLDLPNQPFRHIWTDLSPTS